MKITIAAALAAAAALLPASAQAATLFNFELNGDYGNSAGAGAISPNGGNLSGGGYSFGANQGLSIDLGGSALSEYAIETRFSFDTVGGYRKVLDFAGRTADTGLYVSSGTLYFYPVAGGPAVITAGQLATLRLERTAAGQVTAFVNGAQQFTFLDDGARAVFASGRPINLFLDDGQYGGEASAGFVDYVRVFDRADGRLPLAAVPEPSTWTLLILGFGALGGALRKGRRRPTLTFA